MKTDWSVLRPCLWLLFSLSPALSACGTPGSARLADADPPSPIATQAYAVAQDAAEPSSAERPREDTYPELITVAGAVEEALTRNRTVLQARINALVSDTFRREARAGLLPRFDIRGTYDRRDEPPQAVAPELGTTFTVGPDEVMGLSLVLDFPIYGSGRYLNGYHAARLAQRSSEEGARATDADIAALVTAAAFDLLEAKGSLEAARANEAAFEQQVKDAQALRDAGRVTEEAVLEAQVSHDVARRDRERLESSIPVLRVVLNGLLARPTNAPIDIVDAPVTEAPRWNLADLEVEALERRPEMRAAKLDLEGAERSHKAAFGRALPELRGRLGWSTTDSDFQNPKDVGSFGLALDIPVFAGGANMARIRRARHEIDLARIRMDDMETRILTEVSRTHRAVIEAYRDIPVAQRSVARAEESLRIQREKFTSGRATSREVLDSTTLLATARFARVAAIYNYNVALQDLHRVRGADPHEPPLTAPGSAAPATEE